MSDDVIRYAQAIALPFDVALTQETSVITRGSPTASPYCGLVDTAFRRTMALDAKLPNAILGMAGMSGRKYRRFINNLVGSLPEARYLEIGSFAGSTVCSAMFDNPATILCIDNWSEFGGPKDVFLQNTGVVTQHYHSFSYLESDFRAVNYSSIGKYNVYLFDGPHEYQDQYDGIVDVIEALDDEFIFICDDWNYEKVRDGTFDAISRLQLTVNHAIEIRTTQGGGHALVFGTNSDWHNGYFIAVLSKR